MFRQILKPKEILKLAEKVPNVEEAVLKECAKISIANAERSLVTTSRRIPGVNYQAMTSTGGYTSGYLTLTR